MCRAQGGVWFGWLPRWGIFLQPVAFLMLLTAGMAESKRVPFDLPEGESELVAGYFTEYSGGKQAVFMLTDFAEVVLVSVLITTVFLRRMAGAVALSPTASIFPAAAFLACRNVVGGDHRRRRLLGQSGGVLLAADSRSAGRCRAFATTN